jgi:hypothetical protein
MHDEVHLLAPSRPAKGIALGDFGHNLPRAEFWADAEARDLRWRQALVITITSPHVYRRSCHIPATLR